MNTARRLLTSTALALVASLLLAVPAQADEPAPDPNPELTACLKREGAALGEATFQRGQAAIFEELYESYLDAHEMMVGIAHDWQMRALSQGATIDRQRDQIDRLKARVAVLREKLREAR